MAVSLQIWLSFMPISSNETEAGRYLGEERNQDFVAPNALKEPRAWHPLLLAEHFDVEARSAILREGVVEWSFSA